MSCSPHVLSYKLKSLERALRFGNASVEDQKNYIELNNNVIWQIYLKQGNDEEGRVRGIWKYK